MDGIPKNRYPGLQMPVYRLPLEIHPEHQLDAPSRACRRYLAELRISLVWA